MHALYRRKIYKYSNFIDIDISHKPVVNGSCVVTRRSWYLTSFVEISIFFLSVVFLTLTENGIFVDMANEGVLVPTVDITVSNSDIVRTEENSTGEVVVFFTVIVGVLVFFIGIFAVGFINLLLL